MKALRNKINFKNISFFFFITAVILLPASIAQVDDSNHLRGKAFSDPFKIMNMPEEWINQTVTYEPWAENAGIAVTLDQHLYPALRPMIDTYAKDHGLNIAVNEGTCGISAGYLFRKTVDIAGFCCPPAKIDRLPGLQYHTVGIGALAILVHPDNPIDNISFNQAQRIYQGKIFRWSELTAEQGNENPDMLIKPVARLHCKIRPGHWRLLLDNEDLFGVKVNNVGSIEDVIMMVYDDPRAIGGTETLYMAHHRYTQKRQLKPLRINGYSPDEPRHLISGKYPFYFSYNITTWEKESIKNPHAQELVNYILQQAERIESKFGIIPSISLREAGWKFKDNELIGEPGKQYSKDIH